MTIYIYDFDLTLTGLNHTFKDAGLRDQSQLDPSSVQQLNFGIAHSERNIKVGISQKLNNDEQPVYAIVTHHNNPAFIAGYMSRILGKTVSFVAHEYDPAQDIALAEYEVRGECLEKPLFISYIPKVGAAFSEARCNKLHGKNEQLIMLQERFIQTGFIQPGEFIHFYDDDVKNIIATQQIPNMNIVAHHVDGEHAQFRIIENLADALISQDKVLRNMAQCGLVYPKTLSREEAQNKANQTMTAIIRESTSVPGLLALSVPNEDKPYDLNSIIYKNPEHFRTAEMGIQYLELMFQCAIDRSLIEQDEEDKRDTLQMR